MSDDYDAAFRHAIYPPPFVSALVLSQMTPADRDRLFRDLYERKRSGSDAAKVAMNSTYGQMNYVNDK